MKKKTNDIEMVKPEGENPKFITRKEALKKTALIAASAATMMILLSSSKNAKAQATSPAPDPIWPG